MTRLLCLLLVLILTGYFIIDLGLQVLPFINLKAAGEQ
jgi:hypothetical protein